MTLNPRSVLHLVLQAREDSGAASHATTPQETAVDPDDSPSLTAYTGGVFQTAKPKPKARPSVVVAMTGSDNQARFLSIGAQNFGWGMLLQNCCLKCGLSRIEDRIENACGRAQGETGWDHFLLC